MITTMVGLVGATAARLLFFLSQHHYAVESYDSSTGKSCCFPEDAVGLAFLSAPCPAAAVSFGCGGVINSLSRYPIRSTHVVFALVMNGWL